MRITYKYIIWINGIRYGSAWGYQNAYNMKRRAMRKYKNCGVHVIMERSL